MLKAFGLEDKESEYLEHVEDRLFNDLRYYIDTSETEKLGWKTEVTFEDGLAKTSTWALLDKPLHCSCFSYRLTPSLCALTVEWYRNPANASNWIAPVDTALVAHPRVGYVLPPIASVYALDLSNALIPKNTFSLVERTNVV